MTIVATLGDERRIVSFVVVASPLIYYNKYSDDPTKVLLERSHFATEAHLDKFKRNFRNYAVTLSGKLERVAL